MTKLIATRQRRQWLVDQNIIQNNRKNYNYKYRDEEQWIKDIWSDEESKKTSWSVCDYWTQYKWNGKGLTKSPPYILYIYNLWKIKQQGVFNAILWKLFSRTYNTVTVKRLENIIIHRYKQCLHLQSLVEKSVTRLILPWLKLWELASQLLDDS